MKKYRFGVDIGGTITKIGLFDAPGSLCHFEEFPTDSSYGGKNIIPHLSGRINDIILKKGIERNIVSGIGIGVPGPVLRDGTVNKCVNLGWGRFNIEECLGELMKLPVKAANDANAAALGEALFGSGKGFSHIVMVTLGTGIGSGIINDGKIYDGAFGSAGEIGHITVNPRENKACSCGKRGCLEQYASAPGIVRLAGEHLASSDKPSSLRDKDFLRPEDIFTAAENGDGPAKEICESCGRILGTALANTANVLNPELIIIGGGMGKAGNMLFLPIQRYFEENVFHGCSGVKILPAALGDRSGIYGAAELIT